MQFMMLMIPNVYRGNRNLEGFVPDPEKVEEMNRFNEELGKAVTLLSLNGLHPLHTGARVSFGKGKPTVTDGPFIETKEVLGGYWLVEADSKEELVKWAQRCPADEGDVIEIRRIFSDADFAESIVDQAGRGSAGYADGYVCPVPTDSKQAYRKFAAKAADAFKEYGATRDSAWPKIMEDKRMQPDPDKMPFDGKRMFWGGFRPILDE